MTNSIASNIGQQHDMGSRQPDSGNGAADFSPWGRGDTWRGAAGFLPPARLPSIVLLYSGSLCQSRGLLDISLKISMLNCVFIWPIGRYMKHLFSDHKNYHIFTGADPKTNEACKICLFVHI